MSEKHQKAIWVLAVGVFILFCTLVTWFVGMPMIRLAEEPEAFRARVDSYGFGGRVLFVAIVVLQVLVAFIPGEPVELAAGYTFGAVEGSLLTMAGFLIGSWLVFGLVRRFGVPLVEVFFPEQRLAELRLLKNPQKARILAFILMSVPGTPKDFLSYFAGLTPLTLGQWLRIVAIARLPSLLTSTITGAAAGEKNYLLASIMLALTLLMSFYGILHYRRLTKTEA